MTESKIKTQPNREQVYKKLHKNNVEFGTEIDEAKSKESQKLKKVETSKKN